MKKLSYSLFNISVYFICLIALNAHSASTEKTLLVFGDSLSAAYGLPAEQGWPALLTKQLAQQQSPWRVINLSISGETSAGGLLRFGKAIKQYQPDLVILELGANDGLRGQSIKQIRKNLQSMIDQSISNQAQVLLAGMHIPSNYGKRYTSSFHQVFIQLSTENNIAFIPFLLTDIADKPELLLADQLHPNEEGQKQMLKNVWKYLKPLL